MDTADSLIAETKNFVGSQDKWSPKSRNPQQSFGEAFGEAFDEP